MIASAIAGGDDTYKAFEPFGLGYAGGKMGRYVAQLVYWWWRARDHISVG
ncbi:MAG: dependent oxidoreductase [Alphaproteobacteria bacterium]|nr:dependent oxidoreductase [Alphaproteobacteria bacterium]